MTDKQSNHVDTINNVARLYSDNMALINTIPDLATQYGELNLKRGLINTAIGGQSGSSVGFTTNKQMVREALDEYSFNIMAPVASWAVVQKDTVLRTAMNISKTELGNVKD